MYALNIHHLLFTLAMLFGFMTNTFAETTSAKLPGTIAVHIAKTHYQHPVRMLHSFLDVWHMKGPMAEKVALKMLPKRFDNVSMCNKTSDADVVILLEPHMFFNQQMGVFHAEFIARAYNNTAEVKTNLPATNTSPTPDIANPVTDIKAEIDITPITSIKKQAQQNGNLGIKPDYYMEKAYTKAMEKIIKKLETDKAFLATLNAAPNTTQIKHADTLCAALDDLPLAKRYY